MTRATIMKLTPKMRAVLARVSANSYPAYATDRVIRSLERRDIVEHTSSGWRLTESGAQRLP